jgi:hypothetical protein
MLGCASFSIVSAVMDAFAKRTWLFCLHPNLTSSNNAEIPPRTAAILCRTCRQYGMRVSKCDMLNEFVYSINGQEFPGTVCAGSKMRSHGLRREIGYDGKWNGITTLVTASANGTRSKGVDVRHRRTVDRHSKASHYWIFKTNPRLLYVSQFASVDLAGRKRNWRSIRCRFFWRKGQVRGPGAGLFVW